ERVRHWVGPGRIWDRGTEWEAVRSLLATESRTPMGRERAHTAIPLTDITAVESAIALTGQARLALGAEGPPALDGIADIRPVLGRCATEGSLLEGPELVLLIPVLDAGPRLKAWGQAIRSLGPDLARLTDLRDTLRHALEDDGTLTDRASPKLRSLRQQVRDRRRRIVADLERLLQAEGDRLFADRFVTVRHGRYVLPVRAEARQ